MTAVTVRRPKKFNPLPHGLGIEVGWSDHLVASPGSGNTYPANRADCRIESRIIRLLNINTTIAHTCPSTFGSQGSQETLPDACAARVTS